ncbi:hypothetical protein GJ688_07975 [Heliobacillus mobilis]|uniref:Uncharacterized protein n=1 Tax=Heliobacterium mobile TaxID=28064 RepID=A0A6I3SJ48_HELMO|nr:hypothetical protein [Heliobacterium mobile]MTV48919.1 hypothetical protein [Heliobacterium mobile]
MSKVIPIQRRTNHRGELSSERFVGAFAQPENRWFHSTFNFRAAWQGKGKMLQVCLGQLSFNPMDTAFLLWQDMSRQEWQCGCGQGNEVPVNCEDIGCAVQSMLRYWKTVEGKESSTADIVEQFWPDLGRLIDGVGSLASLSVEKSRRLLHKLRPSKLAAEDIIYTYLQARQNIDFELEQALWVDGLTKVEEPWWVTQERYIKEEDLPIKERIAPWRLYARMRGRMDQKPTLIPGDEDTMQQVVNHMVDDVINTALVVPWKSEKVKIQPRMLDAGSLDSDERRRYEVEWLKSSVVEKPVLLDILGPPWQQTTLYITVSRLGRQWWLSHVDWAEPQYLTMVEKVNKVKEPFFFRVYELGKNVQMVTNRLDSDQELFCPMVRINDYWEERTLLWKSRIDEGQDKRCTFYLIGHELVMVCDDDSNLNIWERRLFSRATVPVRRGRLPLWLKTAFTERMRTIQASSFDEWSRLFRKTLSFLSMELLELSKEWWPRSEESLAQPEVYWSLVLRAWSEWLNDGEPAELANAVFLLGHHLGTSPEQLLHPHHSARGLLLEFLTVALPPEQQPPGLRHELDLLHPPLARVLKKWFEQPFGLYQIVEWRSEGTCWIVDLLRDRGQEIELRSYFEPPQAGKGMVARLLPMEGQRYCLLGCLEVDPSHLPLLKERMVSLHHELEVDCDEYLPEASWRFLGEVLQMLPSSGQYPIKEPRLATRKEVCLS